MKNKHEEIGPIAKPTEEEIEAFRKQIHERTQQNLLSGKVVTCSILFNGTLYNIVSAYAKSNRITFSAAARDFIWLGILVKDKERVENGKKSIKDITKNYENKKNEQCQKEIMRELKNDNIRLSNLIFNINKKED